MTKLYMVIPCYNEEAVLPETARLLREKFRTLQGDGKISDDSRIVFLNDGSKDATWQIICRLHAEDPVFSGIDLSRNFGQQNALLAGLGTLTGKADAVISMDADLQDDINAIDQMLEKFEAGCDIVYGVRNSRKTDSFFKRVTAEGFYKLMQKLGVETVFNHAEFRLMSDRILQALAGYREVNVFLRGLIPMIGYRSDVVYYERGKRLAGESKYSMRALSRLASDAVMSLSDKPLNLIAVLGLLITAGSLIALLSMLLCATDVTASVWLGVSLWLLGGLQMLAIGIVGKYVGKIYLETKQRPRYQIREYLHDDPKNS